MTQVFPPVTPDRGLTIAQPRHPYVPKRSTGGGESRIKLSNVRVGGKISLTFGSLETQQLLGFVQHWREARGTARDFQLSPVSLGSMAAPARALLLSTTWKYASPPTCTDICAGVPDRLLHTLEVELISQPRRVAAYINPTAPELTLPVMPSSIRGGIVTARAGVVGGLINTTGGISLPGAVVTTGQVWVQGAKFSTVLGEIPGVDISATAQVNAATPTASTTPAAMRAGASVEGGKFTLFGDMRGGALTAGASVTGGMLTIPARNIGGAAITATATLSPGQPTITVAGGAISSTAAVVGGQLSGGANWRNILTVTGSNETNSPISPVNIYFRRRSIAFAYSAAEITAATGLTSGVIRQIRFFVTQVPLYQPLPAWSIGLKNSTTGISDNPVSTGFTVVLAPQSTTFVDGYNTYTINDFTWTGNSLVFNFAWGQVSPSWNASGTSYINSTGATYYKQTDTEGTYAIDDNLVYGNDFTTGRPAVEIFIQ